MVKLGDTFIATAAVTANDIAGSTLHALSPISQQCRVDAAIALTLRKSTVAR